MEELNLRHAPMLISEAREKTDQIINNIQNTRNLLLEMYERDGWKALGYESWREYGQVEFGFSESRIYQLADAARVEENLSTIVEKDKPIQEGQLRPLTKLGTKQLQQEAWQKAVATAPDGNVTARHVSEVVNEMVYEEEIEARIKREEELRGGMRKDEMMDPGFKEAFDAFYSELQGAQAVNWKRTSKKAALICVKMIENVIGE